MRDPRPARSAGRQDDTRLQSAGGIVVSGAGEALRVALMRSRYGTWVFPKGKVEPGEVLLDTARREIEEEVGLHTLSELCKLGATEHAFERGGRLCRKEVHWFLFRASDPAELRADPSEHSLEVGWFSPAEAVALLSHEDQRQLLREALAGLGP